MVEERSMTSAFFRFKNVNLSFELGCRFNGVVIEFLAPTVILKNIIFLPIVFLLATSGIRMYKGIVRKESNIKLEFLRHTIVMLVSIIFAIIISCIDAYFSPIMLKLL